MASFTIGKPVTTDTSEVVVDAGLKPGLHRFRLVVVDDTGAASAPDEAVVQVGEEAVAPLDLRLGTLATPAIAPTVAPLRPTLAPIAAPLRPTISPTVTPPPKPIQPRTRRRPQ